MGCSSSACSLGVLKYPSSVGCEDAQDCFNCAGVCWKVPTQMAEQFGRQFDSTSCTPRKYRSDWVRGHAFPPDFALSQGHALKTWQFLQNLERKPEVLVSMVAAKREMFQGAEDAIESVVTAPSPKHAVVTFIVV
mmetsp:Transcript_2548/g.6461  ORF Transcript_2548/g.6461 Transcript_2548/m.6461 type:complete len:135 (-) Transcript_2548:52-456(-)